MRRLRDLSGRPRAEGTEELVHALERLRAIEREVKLERALLIAELLAHGGTWQRAAEACGCTKQALHRAFQDKVNTLSSICKDSAPEKPLRVMMALHPQGVDHLFQKGHLQVGPQRVKGGIRLVMQRVPPAIAADAKIAAPRPQPGLRSVPIPRRR
ncbi:MULTISPECIES: hypothetical protein [unclassified Streptomyces]|uniref:hypothetical protein n=1 Tax=unclassified Streptomyces TaxID=2593676 RepID=UPI0024B8C236|nr:MULTISPECIES: hypothetical protein [unclassified Streptomyces]